MLNKKFFVILSLAMVLLFCFSTVSASNNISAISDDATVDNVISKIDSDDESIAVSNDEVLGFVDDCDNESLAIQDEKSVNNVKKVNSILIAQNDNEQTRTDQILLFGNEKLIENSILTLTNKEETLSAQNDIDVLSADSGTYSDLANEIKKSGNITLQHKNYTYDDGVYTIIITENNKVIDGDGAVIDMKGSTIRAFKVSASGVTIKNLSIKNVKYDNFGGAIYFERSGAVSNCNFTDNAAYYGGAVYFCKNGNVSNCNFTDNTAKQDAGAVFFWDNGVVTNCTFVNNKASSWGGAIEFAGTGNVSDCYFDSNSASKGGAILSQQNLAVNVDNCIFKSASDMTFNVRYITTPSYFYLAKEIEQRGNIKLAYKNYVYDGLGEIIITEDNKVIDGDGAVIDMKGSTIHAFKVFASGVIIKNLTIKNVNSNDFGGAIYFKCSGTCTVSNCNFVNNSAKYGGAIHFYGSGNVLNCNFTDNRAENDGGAICFDGSSMGTVSNCNFVNNKAYWGGAIMFMDKGYVSNCYFDKNCASKGGAILSMDYLAVTVNTCIFKSYSVYTHLDTTFNVRNIARTYSGLAREIEQSRNIKLTYKYYTYDNGADEIIITEKNKVIDGDGAVIDMKGSSTRAFKVTASGVIIKNLTIKNVNYIGDGGAIYFESSGTVTNCNFTDNSATYYGGTVYFRKNGIVSNCNFVNNSAEYGGAIHFYGSGNVLNCNFTDNRAENDGGAICFDGSSMGTVSNCNFVNNKAYWGGAIEFDSTGYVSDCYFANNHASKGGAILSLDYLAVNMYDCIFKSASDTTFYVQDIAPTYLGLAKEIEQSGNIKLTYKYYTYVNGADEIIITEDNKVIDGDGAVIDMKGSHIRVFKVSASGVIIKNLTIKNANYDGDGGAIYFESSGTVTNCNFTNNTASSDGGAVYFNQSGWIINCNFINNSASEYGGAVYFYLGNSEVINCTFTDNKVIGVRSYGGAIYIVDSSRIENCNFNDNSAKFSAGAIYIINSGRIENCNFTGNSANNSRGGAVGFVNPGSVENCNFVNNTASTYGGAISFSHYGNVTNCNFTNNTASDGGAIFFLDKGDVLTCNFVNNIAKRGGAILSYHWWEVTVDSCIFKTDSDTTFNTRNLPPTLNVDNFTTGYVSGDKLTFDLKTNSNIPVTNANISIRVYFKNNDSWVGNYSCLNSEGWNLDLPAGYYYAIFDTEYAEFKPINMTITILPPTGNYYINVTSVTTNNETVNIIK